MTLKTFITLIFLASFVHHNGSVHIFRILSALARNNLQNHSRITRNNHYICPKSPKTLYTETNLSKIPALTDSANNGITKKSLEVMHSQVFKRKTGLRAIKDLDMRVLPSNEVCVLGKKLKNIILPRNYQFQIMNGIAIWLSPCTHIPINVKTNECIENKLKAMELVDIDSFRRLYFTVRAVLYN